MPKHIKLKFNQWHHTCADGCCDSWGVEIILNGEVVTNFNDTVAEQPIVDILVHLGYTVEIEE